MSEQLDIINNLDSFQNYLSDYKELMKQEDFNTIFNKTNNIDIKNYIIRHKLINYNKENIITSLVLPENKDILDYILKKGVNINSKFKGKTLLDNVILYFINNEVNIDEYIRYIIYILSVYQIKVTLKRVKRELIDYVNNNKELLKIIMIMFLC